MALFITFSFAYGISKQDLPGRKFINVFLIITLLLNAGIIPNYILIRNLNLINSLWAVILTMLTSAWNVIVVRSFLMSLPHELEEAAMIDGYNDIQTFFNIIIPLSLPCLASFLLIFAVQYWNVYFNSMLYISNPKKWTLQVLVKTLIVDASSDAAGMMSGDEKMMPQETIRYAAVMLSIFPILLVYPYLQKYFISGITLGAIKG
jgi:putative aldouronate transport system permease protein